MKSWNAFLCSVFVLIVVTWTAVASAEDIVIGYTSPLNGPVAPDGTFFRAAGRFNPLTGSIASILSIPQKMSNGKFRKIDDIFFFGQTKADFEKFKKMSKTREPENCRWLPVQ